MPDIKPALIPTMLELLALGVKEKPVAISSVALAKKLGKSQQAASKHLLELEYEGFIERIKGGKVNEVRLTDAGIQALLRIYLGLKGSLEELGSVFEIRGQLFTGLGEGAYYVSLHGYRRQFLRKLGFDPYPGTLNLRLTTVVDRRLRRELERYKGIYIEGFQDHQRSFGGAWCFRALLDDKVHGAVLVIERTHYDDTVLEIISPEFIRKHLNLNDGDDVKVRIFLPDVERTVARTT